MSSESDVRLPNAASRLEARSPPNSEPEFGTVRDDPGLIAEGWVRRHLVDPDRARESVELYSSMGYEVIAQKLTPEDFGPRCKECASIICRSYVLIYTRKTTSRRQESPTQNGTDAHRDNRNAE